MTPAEEVGLVIGREYVVTKESFDYKYLVGDIITFCRDDSSSCPKFKRVSDGVTQYISIFKVKPKEHPMQSDELKAALKAREELDKTIELLKTKQPETWPCLVPVSQAGELLFNNDKQILSAKCGCYRVNSMPLLGGFVNAKHKYQWIKVNRDELVCGDVAYKTDNIGAPDEQTIMNCVILDDKKYAFINDKGSIIVSEYDFNNWYMLVPIK